MKAIEFESEVALIAQAIGLAQQGFDFVIDAFHAAVVDPMVPPAHDVVNGPAIFNSYLSRHDSMRYQNSQLWATKNEPNDGLTPLRAGKGSNGTTDLD